MAAREMVLYYQPEAERQKGNASKAAKLKGVLIRMGVRIKNIETDQLGQKIGYLAGVDGFTESDSKREENQAGAEPKAQEEASASPRSVPPMVEEEILVMKNFTSRRIDLLLSEFKKAGVPKINLKAVVTETNCNWTFYDLYEELKKEHEAMSKRNEP